MFRVRFFAFLALAFALTTWGLQSSAQPNPIPSAGAATPEAYKLGVADKIKITVFNEPTLSGEFLVNADGSIAVPLIGNVAAVGRSAIDLQQSIELKFADGYLREPHVAVEVLTYRPFYIYGEVTKPGEYAYSAGLSVSKAVALAQGYTYRADRRRVFLKRASDPSEKEIKESADVPIQPGDTIRIAERYF
ncbi:MAG: polysaccharide biosynthesis/export family protein [Caulobacteraceae bacterium]